MVENGNDRRPAAPGDARGFEALLRTADRFGRKREIVGYTACIRITMMLASNPVVQEKSMSSMGTNQFALAHRPVQDYLAHTP